MSYPMRRLVLLSTFFLAAPVGADDKPPAKPAKPADDRRTALERAGYTPVPLAVEPRHLGFSVDCAVGTEKTKFLIDSGSMASFIDLELAKRLKLKLGAERESFGLDGGLIGRPTYVPGLRLGTFDTRKGWPNVPAFAADLSGRAGAPGGVLGMVGMLDSWSAVLDFPARTLYLRPPLTTVWPRLAGTWEVTSWQEEGQARKLDPEAPPRFMFADQRLKLTDGDKTREYALRFAPFDAGDCLLLIDPKRDGNPDPKAAIGGGRVKIKDGAMTACLLLEIDKSRDFPTGFAAPKGSGLVLLELKRTNPDAQKPPADPLRELLLKDGYTAVPLDREPDGLRMATARIGRHDLRLMVDTGMTLSAFDTAGLSKWGAVRQGGTEVHALRGKVKGEEVNLRGLTLGRSAGTTPAGRSEWCTGRGSTWPG